MEQNGKVTMQMIADQLGVTKVSVSKAINNQPGVGPDLKRRILEKARELGYGGTSRRTTTAPHRLEFVISKRFFLEDEKFYSIIYYTLTKLCAERGIRLSLSVVGTTDVARLVLPPSLLLERPDGLFLGGDLGLAYSEALVQTGIPAVSIDYCHPELSIDSVVNDNFYAAYCGTSHLIARGHRQIGFVGDIEHSASVMDRFFGYRKAMRAMNLPTQDDWVIVNDDAAGGYIVSCELPDPLPTAFLCHCDMAAYYLLLRLQAAGIAVPSRVSLLSFDNTEVARNCVPMLTTIDIDKQRMAQVAFERMLNRLEHPDDPASRITLDTKLVVRDSVAPPFEPKEAE